MSDELLILADMGLVHRAYHGLCAGGEEHATVERVATSALNALVLIRDRARRDYPALAPHLVLALDNTPVARRLLYPDYKAGRKPRPATVSAATARVLEIAREAGEWGIYDALEHEADDVIAALARQSTAALVMIASADKDLYQLIDKRTMLLRPRTSWRDAAYYHLAEFGRDYGRDCGIPPSDFCHYKALVGDETDALPGVPGVGPKTAARLLAAHGLIPQMIAALRRGDVPAVSPKLARAVIDHEWLLERNLAVTRLRADAPLRSLGAAVRA